MIAESLPSAKILQVLDTQSMVCQVLGNGQAASECLAKADDALISVSGDIVPGSAAEAKHRGLQDFRMKLAATMDAKLHDCTLALMYACRSVS